MPPNTPVPSACWLRAPAPDAIISGTTPRMKASDGHEDRAEAQRAASIVAATSVIPAPANPWRIR